MDQIDAGGKRRRFRFSLMALLAVMTLAAVILASIDWTPPLDKQFLGIAVRTQDSIVVADVLPNTTAAQCRLQSGDKILALNGVSVSNITQLRRQLARYKVGHPITVTFDRNGQRHTRGPFPLGSYPFDRKR